MRGKGKAHKLYAGCIKSTESGKFNHSKVFLDREVYVYNIGLQSVHNGLQSVHGNSTCTRSQSLLNILSTSLAWVMILINGKHNVNDIL